MTRAQAQVSELTGERLLVQVITRALVEPQRGVPTLIGPTQCGKTWLLRALMTGTLEPDLQAIAKSIKGYKPVDTLVWINPQTDLPEDEAGHPDKTTLNGVPVLRFTQPAVIPPELYVRMVGGDAGHVGIIIDECDKAQDVVLSTLLTLLSWHEKRLRWTKIPDSWYIAVAMNTPRRPLPDPLLARLMFLPYPAPGQSFLDRADLKPLSFALQGVFDGLTPEFPQRPTSPGNAHKLACWSQDAEFWQSDAYMNMVGRGLWSEKDWTVIRGRLKDRPMFTAEAANHWAQAVKPENIVGQVLDVLNVVSEPTRRAEVLTTLVERSQKDSTGELERILRAFLENPEALVAIGRPEHLERAKAALGESQRDETAAAKPSKKRGKKDD